ncbi:hypothetical protein JCM10296v2_007278 [Rhodotorula toruloides]
MSKRRAEDDVDPPSRKHAKGNLTQGDLQEAREEGQEYGVRTRLDEKLKVLGLSSSSTLKQLLETLRILHNPGAKKGSSKTGSGANYATLPGEPLASMAPRRLLVIADLDDLLAEHAQSFVAERLPESALDSPLWDLVRQNDDVLRENKVLDDLEELVGDSRADAKKIKTPHSSSSTRTPSSNEIYTDWLIVDAFDNKPGPFPYAVVLSSTTKLSDPNSVLRLFYISAGSRDCAARLADMLRSDARFASFREDLARAGFVVRSGAAVLADAALEVRGYEMAQDEDYEVHDAAQDGGESGSGTDSGSGARQDEQTDGSEGSDGHAEEDEDEDEDEHEDGPSGGDEGGLGGCRRSGDSEDAGDQADPVLRLLATNKLRTHLAGTPLDPSPHSMLNSSTSSPYLMPPKTPRSSPPRNPPLVEWHLIGALSPSLERPVYRAECLGIQLVLKYGSEGPIKREAGFLALAGAATAPLVYGVFWIEGHERYCIVQEHAGQTLREWEDLDEKEKRDLYSQAVALHAKGIYHDDLAPRNVHECKGAGCDELSGLRHLLGL